MGSKIRYLFETCLIVIFVYYSSAMSDNQIPSQLAPAVSDKLSTTSNNNGTASSNDNNTAVPNATTATSATTVDPWSEPMLVKTMQLWELSVLDQQKLRSLQTKLADVKHAWNTPEVVLGFALTTGWETAEAKFRTMIQWRLDNDVDSLLTNYQPNRLMLDNSPIAFLKDYDREGDPIYVERGGAIDVKGMLNRFSKEELMRHAIWLREVHGNGEWVKEYERRQGRECRHVTVVYDLQGLNRQHLNPSVLGFFIEFMQITEDYYPGPIKVNTDMRCVDSGVTGLDWNARFS